MMYTRDVQPAGWIQLWKVLYPDLGAGQKMHETSPEWRRFYE